MILQENINIKINSRNYNFYEKLIPNIKNNEVYTIKTIDLSTGSHTKILVSCDVCKAISKKPYRDYLKSFKKHNIYCCSPKCAQFKNKLTNLERYDVENVFQSENIKQKITETNYKKYNVLYPSQSYKIRDKIKQTLLINYGVENPMHNNDIKNKIYNTNLLKYGNKIYNSSETAKNIRIEKNMQVSDNMKSNFEIYQTRVRYITNKFKTMLYENWDGFDYYDNEFIKENKINYKFCDKNYPTIDHKISIYYGFINNISPDIIGNLENLCITKRSINASKNTKNYDNFNS